MTVPLTHHGDYATVGETYRLLGRWVAENAATAEHSVREIYVLGPSETANPEQFRTEICWPLMRAAPTPQEDSHDRVHWQRDRRL